MSYDYPYVEVLHGWVQSKRRPPGGPLDGRSKMAKKVPSVSKVAKKSANAVLTEHQLDLLRDIIIHNPSEFEELIHDGSLANGDWEDASLDALRELGFYTSTEVSR